MLAEKPDIQRKYSTKMSGPNTRNDPLQYDLGSPAKALVLMHDSINS
jgi:hypothetical protein